MVENVAPAQTWEALQADEDAQLVDVRTDVEWTFVGLPDLKAAGKQTLLIPWQVYPTMQLNGSFEENLTRRRPDGRAQDLFYLPQRCSQHGSSRGRSVRGLSTGVQRRRRVRGSAGRRGPSWNHRRLEGGRAALAAAIACESKV